MRLINRHNYEEFFLLYADAELSATDKQAVEQFVQANPDLADEFTLLLQMQLPVDAVLFTDKSRLYRNELTEITLNNYEEQFLLYVDNELKSTEKNKVETFVLQHPSLQETFTLLKQTRLAPETIVFPDKQLLYRKEEKEKPLFFLHWTRIAVAAALIGVIALVWTLAPNNNATKLNIAKLNTAASPLQQPINGRTALRKAENKITVPEKIMAKVLLPKNKKDASVSFNNNGSLQKNSPVQNIDNPVALTTSLPVELKNPVATASQTAPAIAKLLNNNTQVLQEGNSALSNNVIPVNSLEQPSTASNSIAIPTVYKELDTEDDKKSLYLGSIEINKDKLRGFLRKAGSLFRSKDRQQEDEKSDTAPATNTRSLK